MRLAAPHLNPRRQARTRLRAVGLLAAGLVFALPACRIEERAGSRAAAGAASAPGAAAAFEVHAHVDAMWSARVLPTLRERGGDFLAVRKALAGADGAPLLGRHGHRERGEAAPWNLVVWLRARVLTADAGAMAATLDLDADGDGKADAQLQFGPMLRGTALRDALPFIAFTNYTNQIEFAQLAGALNERAVASALQGQAPASVARWQGRTLRVLGVFTAHDGDELPTLLPVLVEPEAAP